MAAIRINNKVYSGNSVVITNGKIIIDGAEVNSDDNAKTINIEVKGDVQNLKVDVCNSLTVIGAAGSVQTVSGDIQIGAYVEGDVKSVSGDISCGNIAGDVKTVSGDIKTKKG